MWLKVFTRVFGNGWYSLLSLAIFAVGLSLVLLLPNLALIQKVFVSETASIGTKLFFLASLYGSLGTNFTTLNVILILLVLLLFAIDIALFVFYVRRAQKNATGIKRSRVKSFAGILSGVLGIGCAACGSVILTAVATTVGATGLLVALPFHGGEFALLGIVLLAWSIYYLVKKINDPVVCKVDY